MIKINGWLIPIQDTPFKTTTALGDCDLRQMLQQEFARTYATMFGRDIQIFEIHAFATLPRRIVVEVHGKAYRFFIFQTDKAFTGESAKNTAFNILYGRFHLMLQLFQIANSSTKLRIIVASAGTAFRITTLTRLSQTEKTYYKFTRVPTTNRHDQTIQYDFTSTISPKLVQYPRSNLQDLPSRC